jgi:triacylglycerol lipase
MEKNPKSDVTSSGYVVLLHGLGRSRFSMRLLARRLEREGFDTLLIGYPSTRFSLEELAARVRSEIDRICPEDGAPLHFVTHSLGGIILRHIMRYSPLPGFGRAVLLAPPNCGSAAADFLLRFKPARLFFGPVLSQLVTDPRRGPLSLGSADFGPGVIAGSLSLMPLFTPLFRGPNDGLVSVESAKVEGMADFIVLPLCHPFIMRSREVARHCAHFLHHGKFDILPANTRRD